MNKKIYAFILSSILTLSANILVQAEEPAEALDEAVVSGSALTVETEGADISEDCVIDEEPEEEASVYVIEETQEVTTEASSLSDSEETTENEESNALETADNEESNTLDQEEAEESNLLSSVESNEIQYITLESVVSENDGFYTDNVYLSNSEVVCQWLEIIEDSENITIEYLPQGEAWQNAEDITYVTESGFYIKTTLLETNTGYTFRPLYNGKKYKSIFIKIEEDGIIIGCPRDVTSDMGDLPDYANAPGKFDFELSDNEPNFSKEEISSPGENKNEGSASEKNNAHSGSPSVSIHPGNSVVIGESSKEAKTNTKDIVLSETPKEEPAFEESSSLTETVLCEQDKLQGDIIGSENIENNEIKPDFTVNSPSVYKNTDKTEAKPVSLMPSGYIGGGSTRFNDIINGIITDKITEPSSETNELYSEKESSSDIKSGEFYIGGKYNLSGWLSGNAFPVVLAAAYLLLMGGIAAVVWKKIKS